jgi:protoporphyrinogen/coproporphyrinogen III oxidase
MSDRHVVVVGGGITGLSAAFELRRAADPPDVTVLEASDRLGGKILTTPFAGLPAVDAGPDSVLARVPWAVQLLRDLDLDAELVAPATGKASLWWQGELHPIPPGLVLGLPTGLPALARSRLLSWPGKARAAIEPLLPRTDGDDDLGLTVRRRFGAEVYDRLVGPLVGSINAADPRRISLAATAPQVAEAAARHRSLLLGLRGNRPAGNAAAPVFLTHPSGLGHVVHHLAVALRNDGVRLQVGHPVGTVTFDGERYRLGGVAADAVVLAVPADVAATALEEVAPAAVRRLRAVRYASVAMVTLALPAGATGRDLDGSGYLVPATEQRHVTACSWASSKWAHLDRPGQVLLRASLGRDGDERALDLDDDGLVAATLDDLRRHLGLRADPTAVRVTRWPRSFPQYEPGHLDRVVAIEAGLPAGVVVAGASYRGIGIASCVRQGRDAAGATVARWAEPAKLSG